MDLLVAGYLLGLFTVSPAVVLAAVFKEISAEILELTLQLASFHSHPLLYKNHCTDATPMLA